MDIDALYRKYGPMVFRRCRFLLGNEEDALDAVQEVFLSLSRRKSLQISHPSSLFFTMATNTSISILRRRKQNPVHLCEVMLETIDSGEDHVSRLMAADMLDHLFRSEKKSTRTIAVLYYLDRMCYEEVAAEVGLSVSGVRLRLRKLREKVTRMHRIREEA